MKRTQIYLDLDQDRRLARRARSEGTTKSNVIREAIESYLATPDEEAARLEAFRAAIRAIETRPLDLPDGRAYVEVLRAEDREHELELERRRR